MRKYLLCILISAIALPLSAQRGNVEKDIFGDLKYESEDREYRASLKKSIFEEQIFSDSRGNELVFEKKYLELEDGKVLHSEDARIAFFRRLIRRYRSESGYKSKFKVDIFGTVIVEDNRGNKVEKGTDIFGNPTYSERSGGTEKSVKRSLNGAIEYRSGGDTASLGKDIFGKWSYTDSSGNRFEFSAGTWNRLVRRFGSEENVMLFLIDEFLRN